MSFLNNNAHLHVWTRIQTGIQPRVFTCLGGQRQGRVSVTHAAALLWPNCSPMSALIFSLMIVLLQLLDWLSSTVLIITSVALACNHSLSEGRLGDSSSSNPAFCLSLLSFIFKNMPIFRLQSLGVCAYHDWTYGLTWVQLLKGNTHLSIQNTQMPSWGRY